MFRNKSEIKKRIFILIILICGFILPLTYGFPLNSFSVNLSNSLNTQANSLSEDSILWKLGRGLPGTGATMKPRLVNFTENGESLIIVGTDEGLAAITLDGFINMSYKTFGPVIDFDTIDDISGDNSSDIILIIYYNKLPNIIAIASNNGTELWKFKPIIEGISAETYEIQDFITYTWDLEIINDIDDDSISEVVISSWYRIFVINGKDGTEMWMRDKDFTNDVWKLAILEDINNNGFQEIIAGSEDGKLSVFDSRNGRKLWNFKTEDTKYQITSFVGISTEVIVNSIDDIMVIDDINNDNIDDVLITADDGYLRLLSGNSGLELDRMICYNIILPTEELGEEDNSPYSSYDRLFTKSGARIFSIPDIDNDGRSDYISIATNLDHGNSPSEERGIFGRIFHINSEYGFQRFNITHNINWLYRSFYY
ncbi:MAG: hypothetical protein ACFFC3_03995, partial [Candidatus Odinarchaeota archaeon]